MVVDRTKQTNITCWISVRLRQRPSKSARDSLDPSYQSITLSACCSEGGCNGRVLPGHSSDQLPALFMITHDSGILDLQRGIHLQRQQSTDKNRQGHRTAVAAIAIRDSPVPIQDGCPPSDAQLLKTQSISAAVEGRASTARAIPDLLTVKSDDHC